MVSLIGSLMRESGGKINDVIIANDSLIGAKTAAASYLAASLEAATPEIKNLFFTNVTQITQEHAAMTELALKKGWYKPYQSPDEQLRDTFSFSQNFTQPNA